MVLRVSWQEVLSADWDSQGMPWWNVKFTTAQGEVQGYIVDVNGTEKAVVLQGDRLVSVPISDLTVLRARNVTG